MSPAYWLLGLVVIAVIGFATMASMGRLGGMPAQIEDRPGPDLPQDALRCEDLRDVRFAVVRRGYSMKQVDALLDRLVAQLEEPAETSAEVRADDVGTSAEVASRSDALEATEPVRSTDSGENGASDLVDAE